MTDEAKALEGHDLITVDAAHQVKLQKLAFDHPTNLPKAPHVPGVLHILPLERELEVDPRKHRPVTIELRGPTETL